MIKNQSHLFSLPTNSTYLNVAYQAPLLKTVEQAGIDTLRKKVFPVHITREDFFEPGERLKQQFSQLINAGDPERVAIIGSASYGLSTAAKNIPYQKGQNIVLVDEQFPSNIYPWKRVAEENDLEIRLIQPPASNNRGEQWNAGILAAIDENTIVVSMGHVHWADGTKYDLETVSAKVHAHDGYLVIDGTQSIGALPFDVQVIQPDMVICAAYKWLLGPYSMALAYFNERFDNGVPIEENWINRKDSDQFEKLVAYEDQYRPKAGRYNMGECSSFVNVAMLNTALEQILDWGVANIQAYCKSIIDPVIPKFIEAGFNIEDEAFRSNHLFGIRFPEGTDATKLKEKLANKSVFVSVRGNSIRVAPHVYNDVGDLERLFDVLMTPLLAN